MDPVDPIALARTLIDENFGLGPDGLEIGDLSVAGLVEAHGSPLYLYDAGLVRQRYRALKAAVAGFAEVYYSIKANPNPAIAALLVGEGAGLEIASGAEFLLARQAGCPPSLVEVDPVASSISKITLRDIRGSITIQITHSQAAGNPVCPEGRAWSGKPAKTLVQEEAIRQKIITYGDIGPAISIEISHLGSYGSF